MMSYDLLFLERKAVKASRGRSGRGMSSYLNKYEEDSL